MNRTADVAAEIISLLTNSTMDYGQLINRGALRTTSGLLIQRTLAEMVDAGTVTCSGGFDTYRLVAA